MQQLGFGGGYQKHWSGYVESTFAEGRRADVPPGRGGGPGGTPRHPLRHTICSCHCTSTAASIDFILYHAASLKRPSNADIVRSHSNAFPFHVHSSSSSAAHQ